MTVFHEGQLGKIQSASRNMILKKCMEHGVDHPEIMEEDCWDRDEGAVVRVFATLPDGREISCAYSLRR